MRVRPRLPRRYHFAPNCQRNLSCLLFTSPTRTSWSGRSPHGIHISALTAPTYGSIKKRTNHCIEVSVDYGEAASSHRTSPVSYRLPRCVGGLHGNYRRPPCQQLCLTVNKRPGVWPGLQRELLWCLVLALPRLRSPADRIEIGRWHAGLKLDTAVTNLAGGFESFHGSACYLSTTTNA
jgi:hypothetical protein